MSNRLASEQSPYLLQHRENPVDWHAWGEEAFEKARSEDKPIFLSIGYATCHWCHVMERESFEDSEVAELLNEAFVCVKVDREERPDVDGIYMQVCQLMTGRGGWPLTIFLTPDRKPFYAATYLPKHGRGNQPGLMELAPGIREAWDQRRDEVLASAERLTEGVQARPGNGQEEEPDEALLRAAFEHLKRQHDAVNGGFGGAPKFPTPHHGLFLLRYWHRTGNNEALEMATGALDAMRAGGVYDHIGFGFHRYSTDAEWLVPHFEKMLYDQAMLVLLYTEAYQATDESRFADTAREICDYVLRDLASPRGGFYCAEDADSEGEEGKFYVWSEEEVREVLGKDAEIFMEPYNFAPEGNFADEATGRHSGANIPHLKGPIQDDDARDLEAMRAQLLKARDTRVRPALDDKVITDWNGLMLGAMARAGRVLDAPTFIEAARKAADFVESKLTSKDGSLMHRWRAGHAGVQANLDDYSFYAWGLIELYEATFEPKWLLRAVDLAELMIDHFGDAEHGGFFFTPDDGEELIARRKESYDGAMPSGNAVACWVLLRLAGATGRTDLRDSAIAASGAFAGQMRRHPAGFTAMLCGVDFALGPTQEVVIAGDRDSEDMDAFMEVIRKKYLPRAVVLRRAPGIEAEMLSEIAPFTSKQDSIEGHITAYVCEQQACKTPTTDPEEMRRQLGR